MVSFEIIIFPSPTNLFTFLEPFKYMTHSIFFSTYFIVLLLSHLVDLKMKNSVDI